jgi:hypothetical protein
VEKKVYSAPTIEVLGSLASLTQGITSGTDPDVAGSLP